MSGAQSGKLPGTVPITPRQTAAVPVLPHKAVQGSHLSKVGKTDTALRNRHSGGLCTLLRVRTALFSHDLRERAALTVILTFSVADQACYFLEHLQQRQTNPNPGETAIRALMTRYLMTVSGFPTTRPGFLNLSASTEIALIAE